MFQAQASGYGYIYHNFKYKFLNPTSKLIHLCAQIWSKFTTRVLKILFQLNISKSIVCFTTRGTFKKFGLNRYTQHSLFKFQKFYWSTPELIKKLKRLKNFSFFKIEQLDSRDILQSSPSPYLLLLSPSPFSKIHNWENIPSFTPLRFLHSLSHSTRRSLIPHKLGVSVHRCECWISVPCRLGNTNHPLVSFY